MNIDIGVKTPPCVEFLQLNIFVTYYARQIEKFVFYKTFLNLT